METRNFEAYGGIVKEENVWCQIELGISNTCILESLEPYPGYYGNFPNESKPKYIYLVSKTIISLEELFRTAKEIRNTFALPFGVALANISMFGNTCVAIRISNITDYNYIPLLQQEFINHGIVFKTKSRPIENEPAIIKVKKFFKLTEHIGSGIFIDEIDQDTGYFSIPHFIDWENFKKLILNIKYNTQSLRFDAASGYLFKDSDILDMVRIYTKNISFNILSEIKQSFYSRI